MKRVIAIGGLPCTGKTTLMKNFLKGLGTTELVSPAKLIKAHYSKQYNLYVLGDYTDDSETFSGTDRLSMAVQPEAEKFLYLTTGNVIFEGDRLFTTSFLDYAAMLADEGQLELKIYILNVDNQLITERHKIRGDNQSEKFLRSRDTKIDNIRNNLNLMSYIEEVNNNNSSDSFSLNNLLRLELCENNEGIVELL